METVCGVRIASASMVRDFTLLSDVINSTSYGRIVEEKVLKWSTDTFQKDPARPPVLLFRVKIRARVETPRGEPDPAFRLKASLNKQVFTSGEEMRITARTTRDCFLTVVNLTAGGEARVLVPSAVRSVNLLPKDRIFRFPDARERQAGIRLRVALLEGHKIDREAVMVVAAKRHYPLPPESGGGAYPAEEVSRWLVSIPLGDRTVNILPYQVVAE